MGWDHMDILKNNLSKRKPHSAYYKERVGRNGGNTDVKTTIQKPITKLYADIV